MTVTIGPALFFKFFDPSNTGAPLSGGLLFSYLAGTSTKTPTWTDSTQSVQNANPIVLDSRGECNVWMDPQVSYKFVLSPANDTDPPTSPLKSVDNVTSALTAAAITSALLGQTLYPRTAAEIAASVTPVNYAYQPGTVLRYGTNTTPGSTDMTTAIQNCVNVCGRTGDACFIPAGTYKVTADITVPVGAVFLNSAPFAIDIHGAGREQTILQFTAGTNGVYFNGVSGFKLCGQISDLTIDGTTVLPTALTFANCDMPRAHDIIVRRCTGRGIFFNTTIMGRLQNAYITGCGSAGQAAVEVLSSTTWKWDEAYISSGNVACVAGVRIDKTNQTTMIGGAIESSGIPLQVGSIADAVTGCVEGVVLGVDFEKPNDHYLEFGYGLSGAALIQGWHVRGCSGFPSGAAAVPYAVKLNACTSIRFGENNWAQNGSPTATYWLEGVTNIGVVIEAHPQLFGSAWPWVMQNGAQINWGTPLVDFTQKDTIGNGKYPTSGTISTATASILVNATQGGIYRDLLINNGGAVTMTALTGGVRGMEIVMTSVNGNTTLTHSAVTANQWNLTLSGAANLLMVANKPYKFYHNGTNWYQITN